MARLNLLLGVYQFIGFIISLILITIWGNEEGRMAILFVIFSFAFFTPYVLTSSLSFFSREKFKKKISVLMYFGLSATMIMPIAYPLFFDKEFIYFIFIGIVMFFLVILLRKNIEKQLLVINIVGSTILTILIVSWLGNLF